MIEAKSARGLVRSAHAISVEQSRAGFRKIAVPDLVGLLADANALNFAPAGIIEQAQVDAVGMFGKQGEVNAFAIPAGAQRIRLTRPDNRLLLLIQSQTLGPEDRCG